MKNKRFKLLFLFLFLFLLLGTNFVLALEISYPQLPGTQSPQDFINTAPKEEILSLYVKYIVNLTLWVSGIIALGVLIFAGIRYLISTGKPESIIAAKDQILSAFLGILILLSSYIVLNILNPQLTILTLVPTEEKEIVVRPEISPPPYLKYFSSISNEIPFGRLIEGRVLEVRIEDTAPSEVQNQKPRMERIKDIANSILTSAEKLKTQNKELVLNANLCSCEQIPLTQPQVLTPSFCLEVGFEFLPCFCDPCFNYRVKITELQAKNLTEIENLKEQKTKAGEEIRLLREEVGKLERAEKLIEGCAWQNLNTLSRFLLMRDYYNANNWVLRLSRFWNGIYPDYYDKEGELIEEWATFYCTVSGTLEELKPLTDDEMKEESVSEQESEEDVEKFAERMGCEKEIKVGEIIDRTKRTAYKLVERLEKLIVLSDEMIKEVDKMHQLISQCSFQEIPPTGTPHLSPVPPKCASIDDPLFCSPIMCLGPFPDAVKLPDVIIARIEANAICCEKWCGCHDDPGKHQHCVNNCNNNQPHSCLKEDKYKKCFSDEFRERAQNSTSPCPMEEINSQLQKITDILEGIPPGLDETTIKTKEGIRDVVSGPIPSALKTTLQKELREQVGIIPIIEGVVPKILEDLAIIRNEMKICVVQAFEAKDIILLNCHEVKRGTKSGGDVIDICCLPWDEKENKQTVYGDCFEECYLEAGNDKHQECIQTCLNTKAQQLKSSGQIESSEKLPLCEHYLNFYCCNIKSE